MVYVLSVRPLVTSHPYYKLYIVMVKHILDTFRCTFLPAYTHNSSSANKYPYLLIRLHINIPNNNPIITRVQRLKLSKQDLDPLSVCPSFPSGDCLVPDVTFVLPGGSCKLLDEDRVLLGWGCPLFGCDNVSLGRNVSIESLSSAESAAAAENDCIESAPLEGASVADIG